MKNITNIAVGSFSKFAPNRAGVSWDTPEARFHFWTNVETRAIEAGGSGRMGDVPVIYKNSLVLDSRAPGYFPTRYLDATKPSNVETIAFLWAEIDRLGLIEAGRAAQAEEERREKAIEEEADKQRRREDLKKLVALMSKNDIDALLEITSQAFTIDTLAGKLTTVGQVTGYISQLEIKLAAKEAS